ncbi:MAG: EAL domain-containing protein [Nitrospirae bacterium]|nr:EAL domain-containing protein [Nitrospirota bacterium]MCL5286075.1 EAL domain-containing protein [Nitrospirota bacterium]
MKRFLRKQARRPARAESDEPMPMNEGSAPDIIDSREAWEEELRARLEFLNFTDEDRSCLNALHQTLAPLQPTLVDDVVRYLTSFDREGRFLPAGIEPFKLAFVSHFEGLISGSCDLDFVRTRLKAAFPLEKIRMSPHLYLGAYVRHLSGLLQEMGKIFQDRPMDLVASMRSLLKAVILDVGLTLDGGAFSAGPTHRILKDFGAELLWNLPDGLILLSSSLTVLSANASFLSRFGFSERSLLGRPFDASVHADGFREEIDAMRTNGEKLRENILFSMERADGERRHPVRVTFVAPHSPCRGFEVLAIVRDLTEEARIRAEADSLHRRFINLAETAISGIVLTDPFGKIVYFNASSERMFGLPRSRAEGQPVESLLPDPALLSFLQAEDRRAIVREARGRRSDGTEFPVEVSLSHFEDEAGFLSTLVLRDLSERKEFEEQILRLANFDSLTGLPNRAHLVTRLNRILGHSSRRSRTGALLYLDLDRFKGVNDSLGHDCGDALLVEVGKRLSECVRKEDTVARSGGDEFILLLEGVGNKKEAERIAEKILDEVARPFEIDRVPVFVNASLGIAVWPEDGETSDLLLRRADTAMCRAKEIGNTCATYAPEDGVRTNRMYEMERELRQALEKGEFVLFYQPQVEIATKRVVGAEALIRWNHPAKGLVLPDQFIPVAESTGLIVAVGAWVIQEACRQIGRWKEAGIPPFRLTVNVSGRQFERGNLAETVRTALEDSGVEGRFLEAEVTESVLIKRTMTPRELQELASMGVRTSIDDFGTGYSSLSYLTRLPIYKLKIDRSFVTTLPSDPHVRAITTAIVTLGSALGLRTIAEGVETPEQFEILKDLGCHEVQGYFFSPPLPEPDFVKWNEERDGGSP